MELSNGVTLIRTASNCETVALLIQSEIDDRHLTIAGSPSHMFELVEVVTKRLKQGFSFDVLRDYAQFTMTAINQGAK